MPKAESIPKTNHEGHKKNRFLPDVYVVFRGGLPNVYAYLQGGRGGQKWPKSCLRSKSMTPNRKIGSKAQRLFLQ